MDRIVQLPAGDTPSDEPPKRLSKHPSDAVHRNGPPRTVSAHFESSGTSVKLLDALHDHPDLAPIIQEITQQAGAVLDYLHVGNRIHSPHTDYPIPGVDVDDIPPMLFRQFPLQIGATRYDLAQVLTPTPHSKDGITTTKIRTTHGVHQLLVGTDNTIPFAHVNHHRVLEPDFPVLQTSLEVVRRDLDTYLSARKRPTLSTRMKDITDVLAWRFNPESSQLMIRR